MLVSEPNRHMRARFQDYSMHQWLYYIHHYNVAHVDKFRVGVSLATQYPSSSSCLLVSSSLGLQSSSALRLRRCVCVCVCGGGGGGGEEGGKPGGHSTLHKALGITIPKSSHILSFSLCTTPLFHHLPHGTSALSPGPCPCMQPFLSIQQVIKHWAEPIGTRPHPLLTSRYFFLL